MITLFHYIHLHNPLRTDVNLVANLIIVSQTSESCRKVVDRRKTIEFLFVEKPHKNKNKQIYYFYIQKQTNMYYNEIRK